MRRIVFLAAALSVALLPRHAAAQYDLGGFIMGGQGGGGTSLMDPRFSVDMGYTVEISNRRGPYFGARYTLGMHRLRANEAGFRERYGEEVASTVSGGGGTLYDTGADVEVGYGVGVLRAYGFVGIHYYQQYQYPATVQSGGDEIEVTSRREISISDAYGLGVHLRLTDTGALVAEAYRGGGEDGVMRLSGTRFGLRWAW
jgi:hypothetical protein